MANRPGDPNINIGDTVYCLVRPEGKPGVDGVFDIAIYEKVPQDPDYQFTPAASWVHGGSVALEHVARTL